MLDLAEIFIMTTFKLKNDVKSASRLPNVHISLKNEHFQNAARGPLKYMGPGPSAPHFEDVHFKKRLGGGNPLRNHSFWIDFVI